MTTALILPCCSDVAITRYNSFSQAAEHQKVATPLHTAGFSHLLFHMYTDILHRLQIRAHSLYKVLALIKQKEANISLMYSSVRDICLVRVLFFFVRLCGSKEIYILYIYTHKYILIQTNKAVSRHSNSSTFSYYWYMTLDKSTLSYSVYHVNLNISEILVDKIQTWKQNTNLLYHASAS